MKENFGFEKTYSDWHQVVKDPEVQVVDNCAPPYLHRDLCVAAAEAGKAVICEKPLARNSLEAYEMHRAALKFNVPSMTGFTLRFAPAVLLASDLIKSGRLGKLFSFRCSYLNIESGYNGYLDPNFPFHWHFDRQAAGNGAIADLGSHVLDMASYLMGEVGEVCGAAQTFISERPLPDNPKRKKEVTVDDVTVASLKFKSGALGVIDASWVAAGKKDFFYFEVHGSEGSIRFNFERLTELEVYLSGSSGTEGFRTVIVTSKNHPEMRNFWVDQGGGFTWNHLFVIELKKFLSYVLHESNKEFELPTFRDGYINSLLIDSIVESSRTGRWVKIEPKS